MMLAGSRTSAFRRWFGAQPSARQLEPLSQDRLDLADGVDHASAMPGPPPQPALPPQAPTPRPVRAAATNSDRGRSQTHSRSQHDPTGQNWRWNLAGAAGGPTYSTDRPSASRPYGHDPTGQSWRWNLAPWQTSATGNSQSSPAGPGIVSSEAGAIRERASLTPRRARESSGDVSAVPRPWRRRRLLADSPAMHALPAVPADRSQSSALSQESGRT